MKKLIIILTIFASIGFSSFTAFAEGIANNVEVSFVRVDYDGKGYVEFVSNLEGTPAACGSGYPKALSFDTSTSGGKAILSVVLTAKASGKPVYAQGSGTCATYSGVIENWLWGRITE